MAQAQHGAAIDIMNKGIANPISLIFSGNVVEMAWKTKVSDGVY